MKNNDQNLNNGEDYDGSEEEVFYWFYVKEYNFSISILEAKFGRFNRMDCEDVINNLAIKMLDDKNLLRGKYMNKGCLVRQLIRFGISFIRYRNAVIRGGGYEHSSYQALEWGLHEESQNHAERLDSLDYLCAFSADLRFSLDEREKAVFRVIEETLDYRPRHILKGLTGKERLLFLAKKDGDGSTLTESYRHQKMTKAISNSLSSLRKKALVKLSDLEERN